MIQLSSNAKINLGLIIKGRREDGYHLLETCYLPVYDLADTLILERVEGEGCRLEMSGLVPDDLVAVEHNLIYKAWAALRDKFGTARVGGVRIQVEKRIPAGAGLAGGSSNAAMTLQGIETLFGLGLSIEALAEIGAGLGADVPFFIYNEPLLAKGIGTEFEEIDLDLPYRIELRLSGIHSSTPEAFKGLDHSKLDYERDLRSVLEGPVEQWRDALVNDLEGPVLERYPQLAEIKAELYAEGAVYAAMSGSGSAVYGLFEQDED